MYVYCVWKPSKSTLSVLVINVIDHMFAAMCISSCILCLQLYSALATNLDEIRKNYWEFRARRLQEKYAKS